MFLSGTGLADKLLFRNFVTGCTMLMRTQEAKAAIPFCPYMVHDHYLALYASVHGAVQSIAQPLIRYRIHGGNQTGLLAGVHDKKSYCEIRIKSALNKMKWLKNNLQMPQALHKTVEQGIEWLSARQAYFTGKRSAAATIWKYRKFGILPSLFEIVIGILPERIFIFFVHLAQKNRI